GPGLPRRAACPPEVARVLGPRRTDGRRRLAAPAADDEGRRAVVVCLRERAAGGPQRTHRVDESVPRLSCAASGGTFRVAADLLAALPVRRFSGRVGSG